MNNTQCPNCKLTYTFSNPPKKLKNCSHSICDTCLSTAQKCSLDQKKIDLKRYPLRTYQISHEILQLLEKPKQSPRKKYPSSSSSSSLPKQSSPKKQYQTCLLHSKPADIICTVDGCLICANCALFGQHRGHMIKNYDQVLNSLTLYTEQALEIFDKLKEKQENLSESIISQYIDDCYKEQKNQEVKNIKQGFTKLIEKVKKAQKNILSRLENQIKARKEHLFRQVSILQLQTKKNQWYKQVQTLGTITQSAYQFRNIQDALRYLDQKSSQSFLLKRGQYLHLEYTSSQNVIKNKIDTETAKFVAMFSEDIDRILEEYCSFGGNLVKKEGSPCHKLSQSSVSGLGMGIGMVGEKKNQEDILIDETTSRIQLSESSYCRNINLKNQIQNKSGYAIGIKIPQVNIIESIQQSQQVSTARDHLTIPDKQKQTRSKSNRQKSVSQFTSTSTNMNTRQILAPVDNKKKRKLQIPQKYKQTFQDLKNDKSQVIDFGGAQLGDQNILALCQYIEKTKKLRNLKLVRNKISDQVMKQLLNACYCAKVTNLNLGQNLLTEKSFEMLEMFDLGQLRNVTLSLNKINRRNVKDRLEQFAKRGITLSI